MATQIKVVQGGTPAARRQRRRHRRPQEPFNIRSRPYEITPFMIHPVLPNESLDNLLMQVDGYSDPIVNRNIGWHVHHQFFYVPLMALASPDYSAGNLLPDNIAAMMLTAGAAGDIGTAVGVTSAASVPNYAFKGAFDWLSECMHVIIRVFYRDEDDLSGYTPATSMEYPLAYINQRSWIHSLKEESAGADDPDLPGEDEIEDLDILSGYSTHFSQWEILRDSGKKDLSYDDYLKAQGVRGASQYSSQEAGGEMGVFPKPELLRFNRKWVTPVSTFNASTGAPVSALNFSCEERADKTRYFKEPGFLIGVTCTTPKIYLGNQKGSIVGLLTQAEHWLPSVLQGLGYTSMREVLDSVTDGPLINQDEDYWFDLGDLFNYGGAGFINHSLGAAQHALAIPDGNPLNKRYLTEAEIKSLFVDSTNDQYIYQDGRVDLDILTTIPADQTAGSGA